MKIGDNQRIIIELTPDEAAFLTECAYTALPFALDMLRFVSNRKDGEKMVRVVESWREIKEKLKKEGVEYKGDDDA